jgi:hypothetical protein
MRARSRPLALVASLTSGKLRYQVGELAALPRAAVVIEDRYSQLFKLDHVRPAVVADELAELQIRWPNVPVVFCQTRQLAEEYTYRFLAAATPGRSPNTLLCKPVTRNEVCIKPGMLRLARGVWQPIMRAASRTLQRHAVYISEPRPSASLSRRLFGRISVQFCSM